MNGPDIELAWAEALAAKSEGWLGPSIHQRADGSWRAYVVEHSLLRPMPVTADGPDPAAALRALTVKLLEKKA